MKHLFTLNRFFIHYKWRFILGILFVTGSNYFGILIPQKIREALDIVQKELINYKAAAAGDKTLLYEKLSETLLYFSLIVIGFMILKGVLMYYMRQTIIVMSRLIEYDQRKEIYAHLNTLDQGFYRRNKTGDIMARISEDVSKVRNYLGPGILYGINLVTLFAMTIYAMVKVNLELTLYALLPLPFLSISIYYVSKLINEKSTAIQQQLSKLNSVAQEAYSGIRVVKSYVKEDQFVRHFASESDVYMDRSLQLAKVEAWFQPLIMLLIAVSTLLVVLMGGYQVYAGKLTPGNIAEFILYVNMLTWPVTSIGWIASIVQEAEASQKRINELLETNSEIGSSNNDDYQLNGDIVFQNVSYTYPDTGVQALKNVSFTLKSGQKMAILGRTASGKSTIADLLLRIFDPTEGHIYIDGKDIKDHNIHIIRQQVGYVPQDAFLFSDTVASNIAFGKESSTQEDIKQYAEFASVHEDIERLPQGYDTLVGERGVTLSGGQKQRIAIARAFIKKPEIVILDDALSAVDSTTEQKILGYLRDALHEKTSIVITHRANNLLEYDKILVMDNGEIVESGTHDELIQFNGFYASVYDHQLFQA